MKPIRFTRRAEEQCVECGASIPEVEVAIREGAREPAKRGRLLCRANFAFDGTWAGRRYRSKQVASVVVEEQSEIVVITVYTFFF